MTRTYVIQPDAPALGAAERAARFDDLTAIIELPASGGQTLPARLYVDYTDGRFIYEWAKNPDVRDAPGFHRFWLYRAEVRKLIDGSNMPASIVDARQRAADWLAAARAREAEIVAMTPEQRALAHAAAEMTRGDEHRSNANREQPTKTSRKCDRNRMLAHQSEAAAQRAALLP